MKIAIATDDGKTISQHFGQAPYFQVVSLEDGKITGSELREKPYHQGHNAGHDHAGGNHPHKAMLAVIEDCQVVVAGGMGSPMYNNLLQRQMQPVLTDKRSIDEAVQAYLSGNLDDQTGRVHQH